MRCEVALVFATDLTLNTCKPVSTILAALLCTGALQPTCESMTALMQDAELLHGFDDPDIMAAVAEIASCPAALQKYAHDAKVHAH